MLDNLKRVVREPLVHFLLIAAGIYAAYGIFGADDDVGDERRITVSANDVQGLAIQWTQLWGRPPTEDELAEMVRDQVRVQAFYKEALAMGLDQGDLAIERRLAQKVETIAKVLTVVADPTEETLRDWYALNPEKFKQPDRYSVAQVFFDPDKRDATILTDAQVALDALRSLASAPDDLRAYGDRFMLRNQYTLVTVLELRKQFGSGFVDQILELEPGKWHGPILSGYGVHLVLINDVVLSPPPAFETVRTQIKDEWAVEQIDERTERVIDELISQYEIVVEDTEVPMTVTGQRAVL